MTLAKASPALCALVGLVAALVLVLGEKFSLLLMGAVYGVVVGGCCYIFSLCLAFLLCLLVPKSMGKMTTGVTVFFLAVAPVLAGVVVYLTLERMV